MPSLPWSARNKPHNVEDDLKRLRTGLQTIPTETLVVSAIVLGSVTTLGSTALYRRFFKRIPTSEWITPNILKKKRWIKGVVTSVGDADNFRLYHTPGFGWKWPLKFRRIPTATKELGGQTIHIRLAGVDAPEAAHFGRPSQPYAEQALQWLKSNAEGKTVYCQLIRKDQYSRVVAVALLAPRVLPGFLFSGKFLSLEMLRAGWVEVYEQAGAEYGKWGKDEFLRAQAEAQASRRGIWKSGMNAESPSEYKRRYREADAAHTSKPSAKPPGKEEPAGFLRQLFGRSASTTEAKTKA
ncbi:hypothetical protein HETIRDRAFT_459646 [Heterobasidion irregulare TC 32-1]|uniref:TNase-like domain-containing protein n=1 Tax=Heterobasidion irregulare (strain TC 32-1) TaxID=747525 RepID=W4K1A0_HETIT|nr:uncharacterized protein HETIRDRAFT_459646 [Heterobasidion irregulare TC 32-1]ETW79608.1 hypothetical protein HETIRDRAFT_459646 [Heterobasidion irregulare TC 32-1]